MKTWMDGCSYGVLLLCCCFAVVLLLLLFCCSSADDEDDEDENSGDDDDMCFPPQADRNDSRVLFEYNRLYTHYTAGLTSAHSLLLRSIATPFGLWF